MKNKLTKLLTLILSLLAITCFSLACSPSTPDNGGEGQTPPQHTHEYTTEYKYDNDYHWFECECGEDKGNAPHSLIEGKCVCGYEKKEEEQTPTTPDIPTHTHDYTINNFDDIKHWKECSCGDKKDIVQHTYADNKCSCGYNKSQSEHTHTAGEWIIETPATCTRVGYRFKKCTDCGSVVETGQIDYAAHAYVYGECSVCSAIDSTYMTEGLLFGLNETGDGYIVKTYNGTSVDIIIPEIYKGKPVVAIEESAFEIEYCRGMPIETLKIYSQNLQIYDYAFRGCENLISVEFLGSVTSIGYDAFHGCHNLESVTLSDNIISMDFLTFEGCDKLQFNEKDGAKYLGSATNMYICLYEGISGDIIVSDGCKYARQGAFLSSEITSLTIPKSIINLDNIFAPVMADAVCGRGITRIDVDKDNPYYKSIDGNLYSKDGKELSRYAIGKTATEFSIPDGVTSIGNYAFYGCDSLTSVEIGDSVKDIGYSAFSNCYSLTSVVIGDSVESIGDYAFYNCDSLTSVLIPNSVTNIGNRAFYVCDSLTSVDIGDGVESIGDYAFGGCASLTSVVIGDSVTSIGEYAFSYCDSLKSVVIPNSVTSIGECAFYSYYLLTIYCEAESKPSGWDEYWNASYCPVVWGYKG